MSNYNEINATYGSDKTPCTVFVYGHWYAVEGSTNANLAPYDFEFEDGIDIEDIADVDTCTASRGVQSCEHLEAEVDDDYSILFDCDDDLHDVDMIRSDFIGNNLDIGDCVDRYTHANLALNDWINGHKSDALDRLQENSIDPVTAYDGIVTDAERLKIASELIQVHI